MEINFELEEHELNNISIISYNVISFEPCFLWVLVPVFDLLLFSHSVVSDSATSWTAAWKSSLSFTTSQSLLKLMSIELVMPSNHLILCHPLLQLPSMCLTIRVFSNESALHIGGESTGASASATVLPMNIQD